MMKQTIKTMLALLALLVSSTGAWADTVHYLDESGTDQTVDATAITSESTSLAAGWYYVEGDVTIYSQVSLTGNVNIILCDNATLTINSTAAGIMKTGNYDVKIYAQSTGAHMGQLSIIAANEAIFSYRTYIYGGNISVSGSVGIKADDSWTDDGIAITNGIVNATGTNGDGLSTNNSILNISGGQVTATGSEGHYGINAGTGEIKLSWSRPEDFIQSNNYNANTMTLVRDFKLNGGTTAAYWTSSSDNNINGYKIVPANIVAKIGNMYYPTLQATFNAAADHDVIDILTDINEPTADKTYTGDHNHTFNLNGHSVTFGSHNAMGSLTINGSGTLICNSLNNTNVNGDKTLTIDGATVVCNNGIEWTADHIVLKGGADVTVYNSLFLGGGENKFTFTIQDNASILKMINCTISGYGSNDVLRNQFLPYVQPGMTLHVGDGIANTVSFRETWGLQLNHSFSTNATVTFWNGGTSEPVSDSFDPTLYSDANKITKIDNAGDTEDRYIIMHIVPAAGYWTDQQLLMAMETGASLAPSKAPGLDLGQALTLLKADDGRHDGAGWYYYKLSKDHNVTNGYYNSTLDGFVVPKFDLETTAPAPEISADKKTYTFKSLPDWSVAVTVDDVSFTYNGSAQGPQINNTSLVVKKGNDVAATFTNVSDHITTNGTATNAGATHPFTFNAVNNGIFTQHKDVPFAITPKAVTLTSGNKSREYNGSALTNAEVEGKNANGLTVETGWIDGEGATYSFTGTQTTVGNSANAFTYTLKTGTLASNYSITKTEGTLTVTQNTTAITVTPGSGSKTYDGTPLTKTAHDDFTVTGVPAGFTWTATADGTVTNVTPGDGEKAVNAVTSFKIFKGNADVTNQFSGINTSATGTLTITQKALTITADSETKIYDGTALTKNSYTNTALAAGDAITSVTITGSQTNVGSSNNVPSAAVIKNAGNVDVTANYNITYVNGTLTVNTKRVNDSNIADDKDTDIIIEQNGSATASASYTYNGSEQKPTITVKDGTTVIPEGEYTISYKDANDNAVENPTNAGTYTVVITDKDGGNYDVSGTTTFTITKKALTITADNASKLYDGTALTKNSYTNTELATGDAIKSVTITGSQTAVGSSNNVPSAAVIKNGSDADVTANYNITYVNGTLEVTKKTVKDNPNTGTGESQVSIVLANIPADGYTYDGTAKTPTVTVKDGDNVIPSTEYTVTITNNTNAGTATVTITDNDGGNYTVSGTTTFTINKATLTVTANNLEKEVGADDPALTYTYEGLAAGDAISGALTRAAGEAVGSYAINQGTLSAGNNYTIDYTGAQLTIYRTLSLFSGSNEWATYVAQENLAVPAGIKAYIVTSVNGNTIITKNISYIPADVPILLQRTDNTVGDVKAVAGTGTDDVSGNKLVGNATAATDIQAYKDYVLYNNQFVLAGVSSVGAGKAYLPATAISSPAGAPRFLTISNDSETMGIGSLTPTLSEGEGAWYTLDGHKLNGKPAKKGLYIKNGVKVVIK